MVDVPSSVRISVPFAQLPFFSAPITGLALPSTLTSALIYLIADQSVTEFSRPRDGILPYAILSPFL